MKKTSVLIALATTLAAGSAMADTTSSSTVSSSNAAQELLNHMTVSYLNVFYGPSMANPNMFQPNQDTGANDAPLQTKNYLAAEYKLNDHIKVGPVLYVKWQPVAPHEFTMMDPFVKVTNSKFISKGNFSMLADLRVMAPVSQTSKDANRLTSVMSKQVTGYEIPNSRFSLNAITYAQVNVNRTSLNKAGALNKDLEVYLGPDLEYKITPTLTATMYYELGAHHKQSEGAFTFNNDGTDLEPGLSWDITPSINFSPFLNITTGNRIATDTTSYGALFSWKLL